MTTTLTRPYEPSASARRLPALRRMLGGAAVFDAAGGVFCLATATNLARWLSIPRGAAYATGAVFLAAAAAGALTLRRDRTNVAWIAGANEVFALWCLFVLAADSRNALGVALFAVGALSSAVTGVAEVFLARQTSDAAS